MIHFRNDPGIGHLGFFCLILLILTSATWSESGEHHRATTDNQYQEMKQRIVSPLTERNTAENEEALTITSSDKEPETPKNIDPDWWSQVQNDIAESEYHIRWQEVVSAYQSPNRAQNLRFTYRGDGFSAEPRTYEGDSLASSDTGTNPP